MQEVVVSADLGGTNLRIAAVTGTGEIVFHQKQATPEPAKPGDIVDAVSELTIACRDKLEGSYSIRSIAIAAAATIVPGSSTITTSPNMPELDGFPLADRVSSRLGLPVILENDANAAAVGESWLGASQGVKNSVCITLGTGVGGGLIVNGELFRGADGTAGEVGHIAVVIDGFPCGCGSSGCLEQYASATAVVRLFREADAGFPPSPLIDKDDLSSLDIYRAAKEGDPRAIEAFRQMGVYLGVGLGSLINTLNPEMVVIGGGLAAAWDMFIEHTRSTIEKRTFRAAAVRAKLVPARLGDDAGILGAARIAFQQ